MITILSEVKDLRCDLLKLHKLNHILFISVFGVICGADTWKELKLLLKIEKY
ncbi:MAG: transposase family protein [Flavobacteriaceae bacterium]|nr:transposase family protein [Flavobacteriaceae bacterium]